MKHCVVFSLILWCAVLSLPAQTPTFADFQKKGDACFAKKDYACAKTNYERALRIRESDTYCKTQLKKIQEAEARPKKESNKKKKEEDKQDLEVLGQEAEQARLEQEKLKQEKERIAQEELQRQQDLLEAKRAIFKTNYPKATDDDQDGIPWPFDICPAQRGEPHFWGCPTAPPTDMPWNQYTNGEIATNAVALGKTTDGKTRYLVRAGMNLLGYIDQGQKEAVIGAGGITVNVYDMLEQGEYRWVKPSSELFISGKAVPRSTASTTNFIARHVSKKKQAVGVANPDKAEALFFEQSSDFQESKYEILVNEKTPVGILQIKKHKTIEANSLAFLINNIKTSYNILEVRPGVTELAVEIIEKKKKVMTSEKLALNIQPNTTYKYTLGKRPNGTIALVEDSQAYTFDQK